MRERQTWRVVELDLGTMTKPSSKASESLLAVHLSRCWDQLGLSFPRYWVRYVRLQSLPRLIDSQLPIRLVSLLSNP